MYSYIIGKVTEISGTGITLDNNGVGYFINTPNPYAFNEGEEYKVYIYQQIKEDEHLLFGFKTTNEKDMFLKLISVKGMGCKLALPILATGSVSGIVDAIERENVLYLKKFPKIGDKVAKQMILDLKGKLNTINTGLFAKEDLSDELFEVLLGLGYKQADIKKVINKVNANNSLEEQVKEALKLMLK